ncbi:MAG: hypothetical protein ACRC8A_12370 [Microcoleaceae cyanobacterium]
MTQSSLRRASLGHREPWYGSWWKTLKHFPQGLAEGNSNPPQVSGEAAAALISAAIGCFTMMVSHHLSDADKTKTIEKKLLGLGGWIPGADNPDPMWGNIGSYSGKETMLLIGWLVSWAILYVLLKDKQVKARTIFLWMIGLITFATAMCWHPLFPYLPLV